MVALPRLDPALVSIAEICSVCNEAVLECKGGVYKAVGGPTEAALKVSACVGMRGGSSYSLSLSLSPSPSPSPSS